MYWFLCSILFGSLWFYLTLIDFFALVFMHYIFSLQIFPWFNQSKYLWEFIYDFRIGFPLRIIFFLFFSPFFVSFLWCMISVYESFILHSSAGICLQPAAIQVCKSMITVVLFVPFWRMFDTWYFDLEFSDDFIWFNDRSYGWYFTFVQGFVYLILIYTQGFTTKQMVNPWKTYVKLSAVLMGSHGLTKGSLAFLNYPAQLMFKSTKVNLKCQSFSFSYLFGIMCFVLSQSTYLSYMSIQFF